MHVENEQVFCTNRIVENAKLGAVAVATANGLVLFVAVVSGVIHEPRTPDMTAR